METTLHRELKLHYAADPSQTEVRLGRFRIDAIADGELIEVQHGSLAAIRDKVRRLSADHALRVVKPIVVANIDGFWDPFLKLLAHMRDDQFIRNGINVRFIVVEEAAAIVPAILQAAKASTEAEAEAAITAKF